jgi:hypothetical protein
MNQQFFGEGLSREIGTYLEKRSQAVYSTLNGLNYLSGAPMTNCARLHSGMWNIAQ